MLLLGFLLVSAVSAEVHQVNVDNYIVEIEDRVLRRVSPTNRSSDHLDLSGLPFGRVDANCFKEVNGLKRLSFKNINFVDNLPPLVFRFLSELEYLELVNSRFWDLRYVFWGLSNLRELDLTNSGVTLRTGIFFGLTDRTKFVLKGSTVPTLRPTYFLEPYPYFGLCMINGIVQWLDVLDSAIDVSERCDMTYRPMRNAELYLGSMGIQGFEKGWFRVPDVHVTRLSLSHNHISHLTSDLVNNLPEYLQELDLSWNNITSIERGAMDNLSLQHLDLHANLIERIDFSAFANTRLTYLRLSFNLTSTMPQTLQDLTIEGYMGAYKSKFADFRG